MKKSVTRKIILVITPALKGAQKIFAFIRKLGKENCEPTIKTLFWSKSEIQLL